MNLTLISKTFKTSGAGLGSYAKMIYETLKDDEDLNIKIVSQDNSFIKGTGGIFTILFSLFQIPFKLRKSNVYHCLNPMETFYLNPEKSVVTIHDFIFLNLPENTDFYNKIVGFFYKLAIKKSIKFKNIVADSQKTYDEVLEGYDVDEKNLHLVRPPIDKNFNPLFKKHDVFTVGTISNLAASKRADVLIKSFLKADIKNSQLLIGGKGLFEKKLKKLAKDDPRIKFLGFVDDDEMNNFYNSLDVFVFPTIQEGYGMPMVEAMACGIPVVTLDDSLIPEDIKERTHVSSISNLADDLKNRNFKCNIEKNINFAKEEHSYEKIKNQLKEIYKSTINQ